MYDRIGKECLGVGVRGYGLGRIGRYMLVLVRVV